MARLLVADDEPRILELMEKVLGKRGHEVETYGDGDSAAEALEAAISEYDLVITDLKMPGRSGLEVLALAKKLRPQLPVIIITGSTDPETRARADALGVYMLLHKPVDLAYLMTIIDGALAGMNPVAPRENQEIRKSGNQEIAHAPAASPGTGLGMLPLIRVIDRDPTLATMIAWALKKQGWRATTSAAGGGEAPAIAIVGSTDGVEAARHDAPRAVLIALYTDGPTAGVDTVKALDAGADVTLARPFDPEVLFAHVRAALRRLESAHGLGPKVARPSVTPPQPPPPPPITRNRIAAVKI